jgi:Uma2 family endonuclease
VELRSESDSIKTLQAKMQEYIDNGAKLGWLIDPQSQEVTIYQLNQSPKILSKPNVLDGGELMPEFVCELDFLW